MMCFSERGWPSETKQNNEWKRYKLSAVCWERVKTRDAWSLAWRRREEQAAVAVREARIVASAARLIAVALAADGRQIRRLETWRAEVTCARRKWSRWRRVLERLVKWRAKTDADAFVASETVGFVVAGVASSWWTTRLNRRSTRGCAVCTLELRLSCTSIESGPLACPLEWHPWLSRRKPRRADRQWSVAKSAQLVA